MSRFHSAGFAVKALNNQIKRSLQSDSCGPEPMHRLTGMQRTIIGYLADRLGQDVFQRDLEEAFNIRRSTASGILQLMEQNGLLRREPVEYDARLKKLILTDAAIAIRHEAMIKMNRFEERLTKGLTGEELETFYRVVDKMIENIK